MTQNEKILNHMKRYGEITPLDAIREYGCMRLTSRIGELKQQGVPIRTRMVKVNNRSGEPVRVAAYSLAEEAL